MKRRKPALRRLWVFVLAELPKPTMSFIDLEFVGSQSPDIMADFADARQMFLTLDNKLDWINVLIFAGI
jgi:hypothetical protein